MIDIDAEVEKLILVKYKDEPHFLSTPERLHLLTCPETRVKTADTQWECGCYSEYTRDDSMKMVARISCSHGEVDTYTWGDYSNMPQILKDIYRQVREDEWPGGCSYDEDSDD